MKLKDIIDLAKAGYTPADIKELVSLTVPEPEPEPTEPEPTEPEPTKPTEPEPEPTEPEPDYKKLYEEEKAAREKLQHDFRRQEIEDEDEIQDETLIENLVRDFM